MLTALLDAAACILPSVLVIAVVMFGVKRGWFGKCE